MCVRCGVYFRVINSWINLCTVALQVTEDIAVNGSPYVVKLPLDVCMPLLYNTQPCKTYTSHTWKPSNAHRHPCIALFTCQNSTCCQNPKNVIMYPRFCGIPACARRKTIFTVRIPPWARSIPYASADASNRPIASNTRVRWGFTTGRRRLRYYNLFRFWNQQFGLYCLFFILVLILRSVCIERNVQFF